MDVFPFTHFHNSNDKPNLCKPMITILNILLVHVSIGTYENTQYQIKNFNFLEITCMNSNFTLNILHMTCLQKHL